MSPLIEGLVGASEARRRIAAPGYDKVSKPRDLVRSARESRARGLIPIIAEIKPRILSRPLKPGEAAQMARSYQEMGACAVSVLTEPTYFLGSIASLPEARAACDIPVLRKDFILDKIQLREVEADLVLLIATLPIDVQDMINASRFLGMEPLVEVHTEEELHSVLKTDARLVGINNRNLATLEVDLATFERLGPLARDAGVFVVAESGVYSRQDALCMVQAGADAILVGTSLMKSPRSLRELCGLASRDE
ncbi:MAG: indole-3-glycerol-phosphate synthase [Methanosarcinales archaeon]|nr:indole-3-glycerol-phosphate synthase [Methanosarcinales archaeon]